MIEQKDKILATNDEMVKMMLAEPELWVGEFREKKLLQGIYGYYKGKPVYLNKEAK
jgi:hypothetical protein